MSRMRYLYMLLLSLPLQAFALSFEPASPLVEVNGQIAISVQGAQGEVIWSSNKGRIESNGNQATFFAPAEEGIATIVVVDGLGEVGNVRVSITSSDVSSNLFSPENVNWELFNNRTRIHALALSTDSNTLWVGTPGGLEERDARTGEILQVFTTLDGLPSNRIASLYVTSADELWVGTWDGLAYKDINNQWTVYASQNSGLPYHHISALEPDGQGGIWIGAEHYPNAGLAHFSASAEWSSYTSQNSSFPDIFSINDIYQEPNGGIWIGEYQTLIYRSVDGRFETHTLEEPTGEYSVFNNITAIAPDSNGGLWISTAGGLAYRDTNGQLSLVPSGKSKPVEFLFDLPPGTNNVSGI